MAQLSPPEPFVTAGACPFECCQYGPWIARSTVWVFRDERLPTWTSFALQRGDTVQAETGNVFADRLGYVLIPNDIFSLDGWDPQPSARPTSGDTLYLVGYLGEGFWDGFYRGQRYSFPQFWLEGLVGTTQAVRLANPGHLLRPLDAQWWVRVRRADGMTGWVWINEAASFDGADACG